LAGDLREGQDHVWFHVEAVEGKSMGVWTFRADSVFEAEALEVDK
jgi:hypothetical protein